MICVDAVHADGGGVTILSSRGQSVPLVATDDVASRIEALQITLGEGPCVDAARSAGPVLVGDLSDPAEGIAGRWPVFVDEALAVGVRAIYAFPIRIGAINLGTFDVYARTPHTLSPAQLGAALLTVDAIGSRLLDLQDPQPDGNESAYHLVVHQAAGMIKVQLRTTIEIAMARLRARAYAEGIPINQLAADVVHGQRLSTRSHRERQATQQHARRLHRSARRTTGPTAGVAGGHAGRRLRRRGPARQAGQHEC